MIKRLGDICTFVGGGTPSKKHPDFYNGSIPWATVRDMNVRVITTTEHSITPDAVQQSATNIIPKGEVVISTHVGLGKVCVLGQDTAINQDLKAVIPNWGLSRRYLYYWFISKADELIANGKGATVKGVTLDFVKNLKIQVLSEREQEVVSDTLDKVNHIIELADAQVSRLDQLVKSRFVEMFESASSITWESKPAEEICELIADCPHTTAQDEGVGYPLVRTPNIGKGRLIYDKMHRVSEEVYNLRNKRAVPRERDLILAREAPAGNIAVIQKEEKVCLGQRTVLLRPRLAVIDSEYMAYRILSEKVQRAILDYSSGSTVAHLNVREIRKLKLPIPPLALQCEFAAFVAKVDKLAFAVRKSLVSAEKLYRQQLSEAFL